ncbi:MAG: glycosyltransferase [Planctomycetota bacterium]|nr:glycosyltransferase [Planctomycetota bacterium]
MLSRFSDFGVDSPDRPLAMPADLPPKRVDLHCHSSASNEPDEALLNAIRCPESFSSPSDVYEQAKRREMNFVTITDHDSIAGVITLAYQPDVIVGEELTCYFPEDHCKIHLLVWGITHEDHDALQAVADDIYRVAEIVETRHLAHAVAHPVYRQNDRLEKWHLERLILMFKGFETLNGTHSMLHRQALEPLLDQLTEQRVAELSTTHGIAPRWPQPSVKSRTAGSDDHGLFNIGRTWTEFPAEATTIDDILECIRDGRCRPGGEAGSSLKLAHNLYGVGIRYYGSRMPSSSRSPVLKTVLQALVGERGALCKSELVKAVVKRKVKKWGRRIVRPFKKPEEATGSQLLMDLFLKSCGHRIGEHGAIRDALRTGRAMLGEHAAMFDFIGAINRDVTGGIADSVQKSLGRGEITGIFDALSTVAAHQFMLMPYYFAMFHQNRERHLLPRVTGYGASPSGEQMKLGVFTDTFDEVNGVGRFIQDISRQARERGRHLVVHTSTNDPRVDCPSRKNFKPLLNRPLPYYPDQPLTIPPLSEVLEWADRQQFDAIHVHTPGPMGLCGWLVAKMLRVPLLGTYHTDFPQYVRSLTGDHRFATATESYMKWFYGKTDRVFSRSKDYRGRLRQLGFADEKLSMALPGVDTEKFSPEKRDLPKWVKLGVKQTYKLLYAGRVSTEKNLPFLLEAMRELCRKRDDVVLVIAGDGPYQPAMKQAAGTLPVHFLGYQNDEPLSALYASSDLFVFPSTTDTLGQVVLEAQASGLPVLVSNQGGPKEVMDDQITGLVLSVEKASVWANAIDALLSDTPRRMRMSRTAPHRMGRFSLGHTFEAFWDEHVKAVARHCQEVVADQNVELSSNAGMSLA